MFWSIFWLVAMIVFGAAEAMTVGLVAIWFALGSLVALISALLNAPLWLQFAWFVAVSVAALALTRPFAKRFLDSRRKATNADRVLQMVGVVTEEIRNIEGEGAVSIGGKVWTARSVTGETIEKDTVVQPVAIEGVKLIVNPVYDRETADNV